MSFNRATADLSGAIAELLGLPLGGMTRMQVTIEVRKSPTVDVSYIVAGPRAVGIAETHREMRGRRFLAIREQYQLVPKDGNGEEKPKESEDLARESGIAGGVPNDPTRGGQNLSQGGG